jgi:putative transposase
MGLILSCYISAASMRDEWGAVWALDALKWRGSRLRLLRADAGYPGALASWAWRVLGCLLEIVHRRKGQKGFVVLKGRWVIERTFGWLGRSRRLSKDYEENPESSRAMILWSMTHLMLKRLHPLLV